MMREKGVIKFSGVLPDVPDYKNVELLLGPPSPPKAAKEAEKDPRARKREHYMNLLGRVHIPDAELDLLPDAA